MTLQDTPRANRVHIAFFGKTNAGKSSVINQMCGQDIALVSSVAGTTTDPVYKSMELLPLGPVVLIDTAGLDDKTELAAARVKKTREVADKTDIAVFVIKAGEELCEKGKEYLALFQQKNTPVIFAYNAFDGSNCTTREGGVCVNAKTGEGIEDLKKIILSYNNVENEPNMVDGLAEAGDIVLLVMPQDIQAPKGRLILPQVQVLRDLLDKGCKAVCIKTDDLFPMLRELKSPPKLVITDSQVFKKVNETLDKSVALTSFSMLMAKEKGNIQAFLNGARAIADLKTGDRVLIAEACTHHAQKGDIAREKLPNWLQEYVGGALKFETCSGHGFPEDVSKYSLIVHCGACMINRKNMLSRQQEAQNSDVPMTNFGVAIAFLHNMLKRVSV